MAHSFFANVLVWVLWWLLKVVARVKYKQRIWWRLQLLQNSQCRMSVGSSSSSSNGTTGTARPAAPRLLPLAPDSILESFSEYGGMTLNSSLSSSSCSSCSLSSICKSRERVILPINRSGGAWREAQDVNFERKSTTLNTGFKTSHKNILKRKQEAYLLCQDMQCHINLVTYESLLWVIAFKCCFYCVQPLYSHSLSSFTRLSKDVNSDTQHT